MNLPSHSPVRVILLAIVLFLILRPLTAYLRYRRARVVNRLDSMLFDQCVLNDVANGYPHDWRDAAFYAKEAKLKQQLRLIDSLLEVLLPQ